MASLFNVAIITLALIKRPSFGLSHWSITLLAGLGNFGGMGAENCGVVIGGQPTRLVIKRSARCPTTSITTVGSNSTPCLKVLRAAGGSGASSATTVLAVCRRGLMGRVFVVNFTTHPIFSPNGYGGAAYRVVVAA